PSASCSQRHRPLACASSPPSKRAETALTSHSADEASAYCALYGDRSALPPRELPPPPLHGHSSAGSTAPRGSQPPSPHSSWPSTPSPAPPAPRTPGHSSTASSPPSPSPSQASPYCSSSPRPPTPLHPPLALACQHAGAAASPPSSSRR